MSSRKRFRKEIEKFGKNIRQRLFNGIFIKDTGDEDHSNGFGMPELSQSHITKLREINKALEYKPNVLCLMETRLTKDKGKELWDKYSFIEGWELPREGLSGGLVLAWMPKQNLRVIYGSKNLIYTELLGTGQQW